MVSLNGNPNARVLPSLWRRWKQEPKGHPQPKWFRTPHSNSRKWRVPKVNPVYPSLKKEGEWHGGGRWLAKLVPLMHMCIKSTMKVIMVVGGDMGPQSGGCRGNGRWLAKLVPAMHMYTKVNKKHYEGYYGGHNLVVGMETGDGWPNWGAFGPHPARAERD